MRAKSMQMGGAESFEHVQKPATAIQDHVSSSNSNYNGPAWNRPVTDLLDCQMYIQMYDSRLVSAQLIKQYQKYTDTTMQISTTNVPLSSKMSNKLYCRQKGK